MGNRTLLEERPWRILAQSLLCTCVACLLACSGTRPDDLGVSTGRFPACPSTPNCVTSDEGSAKHGIAPLGLAVSGDEAWSAAVRAVSEIQGARVVEQTDNYLHAECSSRVLGFVDDLQLHLRPAEGIIAVRSASRTGYWDLGVNRRRVEQLRRRLLQSGVIR